jgi:mannan endo-1,4-beta-mannosidase
VLVLWRPLHEAYGAWFWWGACGPEAFKALTYNRLTRHHGLHNLIWVYTGTANFNWYPPDDQFDIIGIDADPPARRGPLSESWEQIHARYAGRKTLAVSKFTSVPDGARTHRVGTRRACFVPWTGRSAAGHVAEEVIRAAYADPHVQSLPVPR